MLPDTGERYMSTPLFEHIRETMDDAETALSQSTPGYRFDRPKAPMACPVPQAPPPPAQPTDAHASAFVAQVLRDRPVVMFALEWCEFCWAARKLFAKLGIAYESVDLDSVKYQQDALGLKIRGALRNEFRAFTIPQIFIGGERIGGCTELFDAMRSGEMQRRLEQLGVVYDKTVALDPYTLLPNWVHPREPA